MENKKVTPWQLKKSYYGEILLHDTLSFSTSRQFKRIQAIHIHDFLHFLRPTGFVGKIKMSWTGLAWIRLNWREGENYGVSCGSIFPEYDFVCSSEEPYGGVRLITTEKTWKAYTKYGGDKISFCTIGPHIRDDGAKLPQNWSQLRCGSFIFTWKHFKIDVLSFFRGPIFCEGSR